jgi:hypothetical protein
MSSNDDGTVRTQITLPCYSIEICLVQSEGSWEMVSGTISSDLHERCPVCQEIECGGSCPQPRSEPEETRFRERFNSAIDGLESLVLAHACAGIRVESPDYIKGIETAVDAIKNSLD